MFILANLQIAEITYEMGIQVDCFTFKDALLFKFLCAGYFELFCTDNCDLIKKLTQMAFRWYSRKSCKRSYAMIFSTLFTRFLPMTARNIRVKVL